MERKEKITALAGQERERLEKLERMLNVNFSKEETRLEVTLRLVQTECGTHEAVDCMSFLSRMQSLGRDRKEKRSPERP